MRQWRKLTWFASLYLTSIALFFVGTFLLRAFLNLVLR